MADVALTPIEGSPRYPIIALPRIIMSTRTAILALALALPSVAWGQPKSSDTVEQPRLEAFVTPSEYYQHVPLRYRLQFGDGRGYLIEEHFYEERYPTPTIPIFFNIGSDRIAARYVLLESPMETSSFADTSTPGGTIQKYQRGLDIVGFRLRKYPTAMITLTGCNSSDRNHGETRTISEGRAREVADYLMAIWGIDQRRIHVVARDLPSHPSNNADPDGAVENRRVEITSNDPRVTTIIDQKDLRRYPQPDTMHFELHTGLDPSLVASRRIEIKRGGEHWATITNVVDGKPAVYNWGRDHNPDDIPTDRSPYVAELVVERRDGAIIRSNEVSVPVWIIRPRRIANEEPSHMIDRRTDRFSLILFSFDNRELGPLNRRILEEEIFPSIKAGAQITVVGYTDNIGSEEHNQRLSERRATGAARVTRANKSLGWRAITDNGVGETMPLYTNELPEGRFYNRTVQLRVTTPIDPQADPYDE